MKPDRPGGFTLIEMLAALAVIVLLMALVLPAFNHTLRASKLTTTGQSVVDELNLARQTARSRNQVVEVRFYRLPDFGASPAAPPATFRAMQAFLVQGNTAAPVDRATWFPVPVMISSGTAESPLLSSTNHPEQAPETKLPGYGGNYRYRAFHFTPNGSADLRSAENSLTLVLQNDKPPAEGANFFTIQINPLNGSVRSFRP